MSWVRLALSLFPIKATIFYVFSGQTLMDTNVCDGVKVGEEVTFEVILFCEDLICDIFLQLSNYCQILALYFLNCIFLNNSNSKFILLKIYWSSNIVFEVTLEALFCVKQRDFVIHIGPSGLEEVLKLNVHVICDCDCEREVL